MKKSTKVITTAAIAGIIAGFQSIKPVMAKSTTTPTTTNADDKNMCENKCTGKAGKDKCKTHCASKDSCKGKDGCSGK